MVGLCMFIKAVNDGLLLLFGMFEDLDPHRFGV